MKRTKGDAYAFFRELKTVVIPSKNQLFFIIFLSFSFFPIAGFSQGNTLVRTQGEEIETGQIRNFNFNVRDANSVSRAELQRMLDIMSARNVRPIWEGRWNVPDVDTFVACPHWVPWIPCEAYEREIYVNCIAARSEQRGAGRLSREAREACYYTSVRPSLMDRIRYR